MNTNSQEYANLSTLVQLVNAHFLNLPDERFIAYLRSENLAAVLNALAADEALLPDVAHGARLMQAWLNEASALAVEDQVLELGRDRTRLYRGVSAEYGVPYPAEAVWSQIREGKEAGLLFETITLAYRRSGMNLAPTANERLDYLGTELAFMGHLLNRASQEAAAACGRVEQGTGFSFQFEPKTPSPVPDPEGLDATLAQAADFLHEHLSWVPQFVAAAQERAATDFYRGHLLMVLGVYRLLCEAFDA